jgi:hypothetical protein
MIAKESEKTFKPLNAGTEIGICVGVYDMGTTLVSDMYQNRAGDKRQHKITIQWELPGQVITYEDKETEKEVERPATIMAWYTLSLDKKSNLRRDLEAWRGRTFTPEELQGFDLKNLLGKACMIGIINETKGDDVKSKVSTVTKLLNGVDAPEQVKESVYFSFGDDNWDITLMSEGMQNIAKKSDEYKLSQGEALESGSVDDMNDNIPPVDDDSDALPF